MEELVELDRTCFGMGELGGGVEIVDGAVEEVLLASDDNREVWVLVLVVVFKVRGAVAVIMLDEEKPDDLGRCAELETVASVDGEIVGGSITLVLDDVVFVYSGVNT